MENPDVTLTLFYLSAGIAGLMVLSAVALYAVNKYLDD